jgi:hypothetical protein
MLRIPRLRGVRRATKAAASERGGPTDKGSHRTHRVDQAGVGEKQQAGVPKEQQAGVREGREVK